LKKLKPSELAVQVLKVGDKVQLTGLKSPELEGKTGVLVKIDDKSGRWVVRMENGSGKAIH